MKKTNFKKALSVFLSVLMLMSCWVFVPGEHNQVSAAYVSTNVATSFTLSPEGNRGATDWTRLALTGEGSSGGTSVVLFRFTNANLKQLANVNEIILQFYAYSCPDRLTHKSGTAVNADIYYITKNQAFVSNQGSNKNANVGDSSHSVLGSSYGGTNVQNSAKSYFGLSDATLVGSFEQPAINGNDSANRNGAANIKCDVTNVVKQKANSGEDLAFIVMLRSAYSCSSNAGWSDIYINSDTITLSGYSGTYGMPEVGLGNNLNGSITTNVSGHTITVKYPTKMYLDISEDLSDVGYSINVSCNTNNKMIVYPAVWGGQESDKNGNFENDRSNYDANLDGQNTIINAFDKYGIQKTGPGYFDNETIGGDYTTCLIHNNASNELSNGANYALQGKPRATGEYRYYLVGNSSINPRLTYLQSGGTTNKNDSGYISGNVDFTIYVYDKAPLNSAIISKTLADSESVKYTDSSWNAYKTALDNAKYILKTRETTQSAVTNAISELNSKHSALTLKTFTVSYDVPAGVASIAAKTFKYGVALGTTLSVPGTRSGYTFVRWYADTVVTNGKYDPGEEVTNANGEVVDSLKSFAITQDWVLYSQWKPVDVNYDNLFSLADWADSSGAIASNGENIADVSVDMSNNSISVTTGPSSTYVEGYTAQSNGEGYYRFKVDPSTKYILEYDYDCANANSVIWLWYNTSGNASTNGNQENCAAGNGHKRVEFTTNADTSYITLRFNVFAYNTTAKFSNIAVYKADRETEITSITNREFRIHTPSKGSDLYTPVRTGYTFEGWYYDEACTNKVGANDAFTKSTTVYSKWTINKYTIEFVDASGNIVSKQTLQHGEMPTVPSLNTASGYDKDYHYNYSWPEVSSATADVTYTEVTSRTDHVYEWVIDTEATCGEAGAKHEKCKNCDTVRNENTVIPATGAHTPGAAATCTAPQTCTACGAELAAQLEHTPGAAVEENRKESTCTVAGSYDSVVYCSVCKEELDRDTVALPLAAHTQATREESRVEATCGADGSYVLVTYCSKCNTEIKRENKTIPATGAHSLGDWIVDKAATCVTPGSQHKECAKCDYETTAEAIPATGKHVYGDWAQYGDKHRRTCTADIACTAAEEEAHNFNGELRQMDGGNYHQYKCEKCEAYGVGSILNIGEACFGDSVTFEQIADNASQHKEICKCGSEKNDGHAYGSWAADPENKDNNQGKMSRICSECSYKQTTTCKYEVKETVDSTCKTKGHKTYECADCGNGYSEILPLAEHTEAAAVEENRKESTCTVAGSYDSVVYCSVCNTKISSNKVDLPLAAHVYEWVIDKEATCGAAGLKHEKCENCTATRSLDTEIPATGAHTPGAEATCTAPQTCTVCGAELAAQLDHTYEWVIDKEATCGAAGLKHEKCENCTATRNENTVIPATGEHTLGDWIIDTDATCVTPGSQHKECANCTYTETEAIPATAVHNYTEFVKTVAPTCTDKGYDIYKCATCDATENKNYKDAAHTLVPGEAKEPTCGAAGWEAYEYCTKCDYTTKVEIPATGNHVYNYVQNADGKTHTGTCSCGATVEGTCSGGTATCENAAVCTTCNTAYGEALGHDMQLTAAKVDPKCEIAGKEAVYTCANGCGKTTGGEEIPALVHNWVKGETTAPTCTARGYTTYTCSLCSSSKYADFVDELGHDWADATCTAPKTCSVCGATEGEALGHIYGETWTPSTENGKHYRDCTRCGEAARETVACTAGKAVEENRVEASCGADGSYDLVTYCTVCSAELSRGKNTIPATGKHNYVTEVEGTRVPATCTTEGEVTFECGCGATQVQTLPIDANNHKKLVTDVAVDATCYSTGLTAGEHCEACGVVTIKQTATEKIAHTPAVAVEENRIESTCYSEGSYDEVVYCSVCEAAGKTEELSRETKTIEKKAHTAGEAVVENKVEATCGADGSYDLVTYCTVCNAELSRGKNTIPATGKHNYVTEVEGTRVPATCTTEGEVEFKCGCGATQVQILPIDANNHKKLVTDVAVDATCYSTGLTAGEHCEACGVVTIKQTATEKIAHTPAAAVEENRVESTCTVEGSYELVVYCSVCAAADKKTELSREKVDLPLAKHTPGEAEVEDEVEGTCINEKTWNEVTYCSKCSAKISTEAKKGELDKTNHKTITIHDAVKETCLTVGYTAGVFCEDCDTWISGHEEIPAIAHKNKKHHERVDATCIAEGTIEYWSCPDCGKNFSDEACTTEVTDLKIEIVGSNHTNLVKTDANAATCENAGNIAYWTCEGCKKLYSDEAATTEITNTVIPAKGHDWNEGVVTTQPTCTTPGVKTFTCENDGSHTRTENVDINADAHSFGNWTQIKAPTCTAVGTEERVCAHNAAHKETRNVAIDANAHTGEANVIKNDKAATCTEEGYTGDTYWSCCKVLETKGTVIGKDANAHTTEETYVDGYVAPTCTTPGATGDTKYKCCNAVKAASTEIPALKHDYDTTKSEENLTRPVFENGAWTDGYYTYKCKNDSAHTTTEKVARASYTAYDVALANLNALLATDITADAKAAINEAIEANKVAENLIASEQSSIDAKTAALEKAFEDNKGSLQTYTVTFKIEGSADVVVTVISGQDATAPANVKKDYDENNHYNFKGWDKAFTNITSNLTVTAKFEAVAHSYTHTDKDDTYHTDKCDCGYSVDVKHTETSEVTTKASCEADGVRTYTCSVCGGTRTETIAKRTHNIVDTEVALAPTCSATGIMNQKCDNEATDEYEACTYTTTRVMDTVETAHKAEADYTVMTKATCEADGYKAILCEYCDAELSKETIVKRAHEYKDNGVQTAATCLADGVMNTICENEETATHEACTHESTRVITKLEHSYTGEYKWNNGADVKTHSQKCVNGCNEYGNETKCTFNSVVTAPNCYANGYTTYTCTVCNNSYDADYTTREHVFVYAAGNGTEHAVSCQYDNCNYSATEACSGGTATCEAQAVCTKCNTAYGEKNADNHTNLVKTDAKTATCENAGNIAYWTCEGCNKLYSDEAATTEITNTVIPAKGHDWNEGVVTTQPTCTTPGVKTFTCENDGSHTRTENVDIDADAHSFGDWTQTKAPTCSAVGTEERVCAHNAAHKEIKDVAISADAHSFGDWTQTKAPTCSAVGTEERVCAHNAAHKETRNVAINPNAHTGTASVTKNYREATCKADGYTGDIYWSCCDKLSAKGSTIPALEHIDKNNDNLCDYNCGTEMNLCKHEGTPKQYITNLGENGKLNTHKIKCLACGQIVKIENCDFDTKVVAPSCYEEGYTKYTCKICTYSFVSDFEEKTEHDFGEWESNNATCHEIQSMSRRCKNTKCLYKETVKIIDENTGKYAYGAHSLVVVPGKDATCTKAGYTSYSICIHCEEVTGSKPIPAKGHADEDGNGNCDVCDSLMDSNGVCGCFCHNDSFFGKIIFKILNFFWKLFKINANCECGVKHW